jgi:hypothetical protein
MFLFFFLGLKKNKKKTKKTKKIQKKPKITPQKTKKT